MTIRSRLAAGMALAALLVAQPSRAQMTVFDPKVYASALAQAAHELEQINNQVRSLQNQATSLENQARNLATLPFSSLQTLQSNFASVASLLQQAQRLSFDVQTMQREFSASYVIAPGSSSALLVSQANARWQNSQTALRQALTVQAGVVTTLPSVASQTQSLVGVSQGATGQLQATQASNQLLALHAQQLSALIAMMAAQGRANILNQADQAAALGQSNAQFGQFNTTDQGYQPYSAEMFH